ncbi:putative Uncharacterized 50.6 kDa protein in the 5'region of gyrA and gyrB [Actinacidiphila bryophytorum]|uniref:Uncharacterized 50.6 kDa protein in the 5'region of gyrA and gyrB n=1 Tax=Actinacidiphila bryophytorum TaxID=1436133 RepID=A0A9W4H305_9ACTN|nr:putative Uncharacterized 50.6 kDa protein in the 5'region of gyrA and gyrB [Actinacidiphila bryophytorum]
MGPGRGADRRHRRRTVRRVRRRAPLRAAQPGDGRRRPQARRPGRPAQRARRTRRAGPADQPAPRRGPRRDRGLPLRRGAEGGHPGDPGRRLRCAGRLPRDDHHPRRAGHRQRLGRRVHQEGRQPLPGDGRPAHRAGAARQRHRLPPGGRTGLAALRVLRRRRGDGALHAGAGAVRLAGRRLHRDHDALRVLGAAEPCARGLRQEHVEHVGRLPQPHPAGAGGRAAPGRHPGARADAPLPHRDARRRARRGAPGAVPAACGAARPGVHRTRRQRAGGRHPRGPGARPGAAPAHPDPRRGRTGDGLRPLRPGDRRASGTPAQRPRPAGPQGVPAPGAAAAGPRVCLTHSVVRPPGRRYVSDRPLPPAAPRAVLDAAERICLRSTGPPIHVRR